MVGLTRVLSKPHDIWQRVRGKGRPKPSLEFACKGFAYEDMPMGIPTPPAIQGVPIGAAPSFDQMQTLSRYPSLPSLPAPLVPELADTSLKAEKPVLRLQTKNFACPNVELVRANRKLEQMVQSPVDSGYGSDIGSPEKVKYNPHWSRFDFELEKLPARRPSKSHSHINSKFFELGLLAESHEEEETPEYGPFLLTEAKVPPANKLGARPPRVHFAAHANEP